MRQNGIRLHLPKSNTSCTLPPLHRLVCNRVNGTGCTNLEGKGGEGRGREERGGEGRRGEGKGGEGQRREERGGEGRRGSVGVLGGSVQVVAAPETCSTPCGASTDSRCCPQRCLPPTPLH